jgi:hypothetical protein
MVMQPITDDLGNVIDEYDDGKPETPEQAKSESPAPVVTTRQEDMTDFDTSDVSIQLMLHRADGDPQGRLVSVIIHNFEGPPIIGTFREAELTEKSRLDSIHKAIYPLMQRFLLDLSGRVQKKLQGAAPLQVHPTKTLAPPVPASPAQKTPASKSPGKKDDKKKYSTIPMF